MGFMCSYQAQGRMLAVQKYEPPSGDIAQQIEKDFGSLDKLVADFNPKTAAIQVHPCLPACLRLQSSYTSAPAASSLCFLKFAMACFPRTPSDGRVVLPMTLPDSGLNPVMPCN